jgi:hypothetical protein
MWSTCSVLLITPLALVTSVRGLIVDQTKWFGLGGTAISGGLAVLILSSMLPKVKEMLP